MRVTGRELQIANICSCDYFRWGICFWGLRVLSLVGFWRFGRVVGAACSNSIKSPVG
jgi:hypothetical protein